ncbi:hypothetical protein [Caldisericum sp. AR60]
MKNLKHDFIEKFKEAIASLKKNCKHIGRYILFSLVLSLIIRRKYGKSQT